METLAEKEERSDWNTLRFFDLRHTLSAALSLERCSRRTSDSQGAEGVVQAGLEDKGQTVSKQDVRVEQKVSVALLASRDYNCLGGGSEDETIADSREGESELRVCRKMTCGGVCVVSGIMLKLRVRRKWSEVCSGVTSTRSVEQCHV